MKVLKLMVLIVVMSFLFCPQVSADITTDLVAYYPLDCNLIDFSGNGFDGTGVGTLTPVPDRMGVSDGALLFGQLFYAKTVPADSLFIDYDEVTVSAWIKTTAHTYDHTDYRGTIWNCYHTSSSTQIMLAVQGGHAMLSVCDSGGGTYEHVFGDIFVSDGAWHHVAVVFDEANDVGRVYVDGKLDSQGNITLSPFPTSQTYLIGTNGYQNVYFEGALDELRVYNRALDWLDIEELYFDGYYVELITNEFDELPDSDNIASAKDKIFGNNDGQSDNGALDKLESGEVVACLVHIKNALKDLVESSCTSDLQLLLVEFARSIAIGCINAYAAEYGFEDPIVILALSFVDQGDLYSDDGLYDKAVEMYKKALNKLGYE